MIKKILIFMFMLVLLVGPISAFEFDNIGTYDKETQTIDVRNSILGIPFLQLDKIAEVKLDTPLVNYVIRGKNRLVAEFTIETFDIYTEGTFDDLEFYNIKKDMDKFDREFVYKYKNFYDIEVTDYKEVCKKRLSINATLEKFDCYDNQIGTHLEQRFNWVELNEKLDLPKGKITIGIFIDVYANENIEWIPTLFGVKIDEWAVWTEGMNVGLHSYYNFEQSSLLEDVVDGTNNGTINGATNTSGIIGSGRYFITDDWIGISDAGDVFDFGSENFTINFWSNRTGVGYILGRDNTVAYGSYYFGYASESCYASTTGSNWDLFSNANCIAPTIQSNWAMITIMRRGEVLSTFVNGTLEQNISMGAGGFLDVSSDLYLGRMQNAPPPLYHSGAIDELGFWNRSLSISEMTDLYNDGIGITYTDIFLQIDTIQSFPADNFITTDVSIEMGCNFSTTGGENITDVTVLVYNNSENLDYTNTESGLSLVSYNKTWTTTALTDGIYLWACHGEGFTTESYAGNRTFTVDTIAPIINVTYPTGNIPYHLSGINLTLNWTADDSHIQNCWYDYNSTNISVTCGDNSTQFLITENSNKNVTFYANDSAGNEGSYFKVWNIKVIEINQIYNNETTEGSLETFLANISLSPGYSITNVYLNYNNSLIIGQSFIRGENTILRKTDLLIPNVDANINISFYWDITLSDSTHVNLSTNNQSVFNLGLDNCSVFTTELLNFTVVDEKKQTRLPNVTIEVAINIYDKARTIQILNLSNIYEKVNPLRICLSKTIGVNTSYSLDTIVRYEDVGFANEYYNIVNYNLENATALQHIILYDLNISDSTEFQLTFTGSDFLSVENALVYINRQYISEDIFKTVELPKTDFNGQAVLHLVRNDVIYNIQIIKDGEVLGTFENIVAFCDDYSIGDCNIELNAFDSVTNIFDYDADLGIIFTNPEYNDTTNTVSFDFITSDGSSKVVRLEVSRNDIFGNRSICNDSLTSSGGTLICSIDPSIDESILKTNVYVDGVLAVTGSVKLDTTNYGVAGYLIMFVMAISFILMFSGSKTGVLISMVVTLAGAIGLGLVSGDLIGIGASGLWLMIIIFIGIYKLNKERIS